MEERIQLLEKSTSSIKADVAEIKGSISSMVTLLERSISSHDSIIETRSLCDFLDRDLRDHKSKDEEKHKEVDEKLASINWKLAIWTGAIGVIVFLAERFI